MSDQRALERLHRAERALLRAGWTHSEGAQEWKPPLGTSASPLLDEIERLRAQLAAQIIIQRGWEDEARKATSQLASARKALEEIETFCSADSSTLGAIARLSHIRGTARQQLLSLTDDFRT